MKRMIAVSMLIIWILALFTGCPWQKETVEYGFAREVSQEEQALRMSVVEAAQEYLSCKESDGSFKPIIDLYNSQEPLPRNYEVQYTDQWCAAFGSAVAIRCELTHLIPTECGCQKQIELFASLDAWEEEDAYIPLPGDYIFYHTECSGDGDCTHWSNHVGIVVGVDADTIKVIEGNYNRAVGYRYIPIDHASIRGFGLPDYGNA